MTAVKATPRASRFADDASRWRAVRERDPAADDAFYYSVRTTGVYCRPTCPARLAKRCNVRFHLTRGDAERAGFRPCRRCRPHERPLAERRRAAVARACRLLEGAATAPALSELAATAEMSPYHFHRVFKMMTGVTPKAYAAAGRTRRLHGELARGKNVTEAMYGAGFNSSGRFYESAGRELGMSPRVFLNGGKGESIHFAVGESSLGQVLVAATEKGVCAIFLGDDPAELARELGNRFPHAQIAPAGRDFSNMVARVVRLVEKPAEATDLPLDVRGTAFQVRVWEALRRIPAGRTASYTEVARRIGRPTAARAVAAACAANPIAVAIPCHRVVRTDASLSGYRWGVKRKAELLRRERKS
jgi:AraC family transcriptional regulator of adaptative response/methylated-DNA-[protein]-cysteine methyltransferase